MSTFASRQHDIWQAVAISLHAQLALATRRLAKAKVRAEAAEDRAALQRLTSQAEALTGAIADYHPYDYQYGSSWAGEVTNWRHAGPGLAQQKALAQLARIEELLTEWQSLLA